MKKTIVILFLIILGISSYAQNNAKDYYFPNNTTTTLAYPHSEAIRDVYGYAEPFMVTSTYANDKIGSRLTQKLLFRENDITIQESIFESIIGTKTYNKTPQTLFKITNPNSTVSWSSAIDDGRNDFESKLINLIIEIQGVKQEIHAVKVIKRVTISGARSPKWDETQYWGKRFGLLLITTRSGVFRYNTKLSSTNFEEKPFAEIKAASFPLNDKYKNDVSAPELESFVKNLKQVLLNKDTVNIQEYLCGPALAEFKKNPSFPDNTIEYVGHELHNNKSSVWDRLLNSVNAGGYYDLKDNLCVFPWYEKATTDYSEILEQNGPSEAIAGVVTGSNVNVRSKPDVKSSVLGQLSWQVVMVDLEYENPNDWYRISTLDNNLHGFVYDKYLYTLYTIRVVLSYEVVKYRYEGKNYSYYELMGHLYQIVDYETIKNICNSEENILPKDQWVNRGWKIVYFRDWD